MKPNTRRTDEVLHFFVTRFSGEIGRVVLVKLAYLADLEAWRHLGRPLSGLRYKVDHHGPFDPSFYQSLKWLQKQGYIAASATPFSTGTSYNSLRALPDHFTPAEQTILDYIATAFGSKGLSDILDVAYSTEPFLAARRRGMGAGVSLKEERFRGSKQAGDVRLEDVVAGFAAIDAGRYTDLDRWIGELQDPAGGPGA